MSYKSVSDLKRDGIQAAVGVIRGLLVAGEYDLLGSITPDDSMSAEQLNAAVESLGARLVTPSAAQKAGLTICPVEQHPETTYDVVMPIWTTNGHSGRGLQLRMWETSLSTFDYKIVRVTPTTAGCDVADEEDQTSPGRENGPIHPYGPPVPRAWRPILAAIVQRLVLGDYAGLVRDGLVSYTGDPTDTSIGTWIEEYPGKLIDLPPEAWNYAGYEAPLPDANPDDGTAVVVDLWTEDGLSDLSMEATVWVRDHEVIAKVDNVHVL